jgi:hypothetical protein
MIVRDALAYAITAAILGGCVNCTLVEQNRWIFTPSGQVLCGRHHIPLVKVRAWIRLGDPIVLVHSYGEQNIVDACNPNSFPRGLASRHRTKEFSRLDWATYCPECEKAVAANLATPDPSRRPSFWRQLTAQRFLSY